MYTKSNEVFEDLTRCPGLEGFPDLCYHWENDEWYDSEQIARKNITCPSGQVEQCPNMFKIVDKSRLCCQTDCL